MIDKRIASSTRATAGAGAALTSIFGIFMFRHRVKDGLYMAATGDETASFSVKGENGIYFDEQTKNASRLAGKPLPRHQGAESTAQTSSSKGTHNSFDEGDDQDEDKGSVGPLILLHVSDVSSSTAHSSEDEGDEVGLLSSCDSSSSRKSAYSFEHVEEERIFEPSFETVLINSPTTLPMLQSGASEGSTDISEETVAVPSSAFMIAGDASSHHKYEGATKKPTPKNVLQ